MFLFREKGYAGSHHTTYSYQSKSVKSDLRNQMTASIICQHENITIDILYSLCLPLFCVLQIPKQTLCMISSN